MSEQIDLEDWLRDHPKTLTEQWKAGKLEEFYGKPFYIKKQSGVVKVDYLCKYGFVNNYDVVEVLAPCDYEELQEKQKSLKVLAEAYCKEKEENQQLKELLKRCRDFINYEVPDHCIDDVLIDKIDEVLK